jgi:hypothetical protein
MNLYRRNDVRRATGIVLLLTLLSLSALAQEKPTEGNCSERLSVPLKEKV